MPDAVSVAKHIQGVDAACFRRMRKLPAVICLQDTRSIAEEQNRPFEKVYGGKAAVFLICIEKPFPGRFLYDRILIEFLPILAGITGIRHIFDIHLPFFADRVGVSYVPVCLDFFFVDSGFFLNPRRTNTRYREPG